MAIVGLLTIIPAFQSKNEISELNIIVVYSYMMYIALGTSLTCLITQYYI